MQFYEMKPHECSPDVFIENENTDPAKLVPRYCPQCGRPITMLPWLPPCNAILDPQTRPPTDFAFTPVGKIIVSTRARAILESNGVRGIAAFHPVAILKPRVAQEYFYAQLEYSNIRLDEVSSGVRWIPEKPMCDVCGGTIWRLDRYVVDMDTWDGSDIFEPFSHAVRLCSQRLHDLIEAEKLTGVTMTPAESSGFDLYPWRTEKELPPACDPS